MLKMLYNKITYNFSNQEICQSVEIHSIATKYCIKRNSGAVLECNIKNDVWVTVNNDFWSPVRWFANDFHKWWNHKWKSLANCITSDKKLFHGNEFFYFLHAIWCPEHTIILKSNCISPFVAKDGLFLLSIVMLPQMIGDITWGTGFVKSYVSIALAHAN